MDIAEALYTTRAMRRVKPDPIPDEVQQRILDAAIRAPSGGNTQNWRFLLVDDPAVKARIGPLYRDASASSGRPSTRTASSRPPPIPTRRTPARCWRCSARRSGSPTTSRTCRSSCSRFIQHDPSGGSIYPAVWSAQLAARAEGVGSSLTSVLGFFHPSEVAEILEVPTEDGWLQACMVSFGYPTGRWGVAPRRPVHEVSYRNRWGGDVGFEIPEPLWPGELGRELTRVSATLPGFDRPTRGSRWPSSG